MKIPAKIPKDIDQEARNFLFRQLASYFTMLLEEWAIALAKRDTSVKESFAGRQAFNAMVQSRENMRPLFKKFETGDIDHTVLEAIVEIVHCAQQRRYVDANDGYLRLSIGKA
jgi:pre-mRNA-splicing factor 18